MLGVQRGNASPCDLWKVSEELVVLLSWLGMVLMWSAGAPASQRGEEKYV